MRGAIQLHFSNVGSSTLFYLTFHLHYCNILFLFDSFCNNVLLVSEEAAKETGNFVWMEDPLCWFHWIYKLYNFFDNLKLIIWSNIYFISFILPDQLSWTPAIQMLGKVEDSWTALVVEPAAQIIRSFLEDSCSVIETMNPHCSGQTIKKDLWTQYICQVIYVGCVSNNFLLPSFLLFCWKFYENT